MATFYEVKQMICELVSSENIEDNEDDIKVELRDKRYLETGEYHVIIRNSELREIYNRVCSMISENLELYSENEYEVALSSDYYLISRVERQYISISEDIANGIKYELRYPTIEYCLYLLMQIKDEMNKQQGLFSKKPPVRLRQRSKSLLSTYVKNEREFTLLNYLHLLIGEVSLKIKSTKTQSLSAFKKYKTSFIFNFMYKSQNALIEFVDIADMFNMNRFIKSRFDIDSINTPPLREYATDVVDYYKLALSSNDPYIKFISFYHVMEYFFDEVFKKRMVNNLRDKITHPDFSYKDEDKIYEIALFIKNRLRMNDELGQGNELESLKYVLSEYISIEDLKVRIDTLDSKAVQYYQNNKVPFCNAPIIGWNDTQGAFAQIAKRVYFTRNSLVHSKSGKNKERYRPYKDEKQLQMEIPLVKAIAESIIINSSKIL
ncbi:hypothetical protein VSK93_18475 [Clostridioides difficile]|uniref:hypothetical protein n=1 Tax=Clostridioides difficile TaxID=1496 RepID=UPI003080727C